MNISTAPRISNTYQRKSRATPMDDAARFEFRNFSAADELTPLHNTYPRYEHLAPT